MGLGRFVRRSWIRGKFLYVPFLYVIFGRLIVASDWHTCTPDGYDLADRLVIAAVAAKAVLRNMLQLQ